MKLKNDILPDVLSVNDLNNFSKTLPLFLIVLIVSTVASVISYYSVFNLHPLNYFTVIDFLPYTLNNLSTIAKSVCGAYAMFTLLALTKEASQIKITFAYFALLVVLNIVYCFYSYYFNTESTILLLIFVRSMIMSVMFTILSWRLISTNTNYRVWYYFIFRMLVVALLFYFPVDYYLQARSLKNNPHEHRVLLITDNEIIKPFLEERFIIGSNTKYYFCYSSATGAIQFIDHSNVKVYEFPGSSR